MTSQFDLLYVSPHAILSRLPTRPARLLDALRSSEAVRAVTVVHRRRPSEIASSVRRRSLEVQTTIDAHLVAIEHPWPFGTLEARWLERLLHRTMPSSGWPVVLWICDPKSAQVFSRLQHIPNARLVRVFDAYDAWDLSPLVRGRWRRRAVANGYRTAARYADVIFANTEFMARRMVALGAARVPVLQNAAPPAIDSVGGAEHADSERYLVYVGRIHERVDAGILAAVADASPEVAIRLIGPVERNPDGWPELIARPNVRLEGPMVGERLRSVLADATALLLPHRVDDYTRSQDAMKAWDAIASGTPVISTPIPPADAWPTGLAEVCPDTDAFVAAARRAVNGQLERGRADRLAFAAENQWSARAAVAIAAIETVLDAPDRAFP